MKFTSKHACLGLAEIDRTIVEALRYALEELFPEMMQTYHITERNGYGQYKWNFIIAQLKAVCSHLGWIDNGLCQRAAWKLPVLFYEKTRVLITFMTEDTFVKIQKLETTLSGITALPLGAFAALMQPIHLAIGLVEGLITAAVLLFVDQTRPELLQGAAGTGAKNRCSRKAALAILAAAALVIGGGLSLLASSSPDGLDGAVPGCRLSACRASDASVLSEAAHGAAARVRGRAFKSAV